MNRKDDEGGIPRCESIYYILKVAKTKTTFLKIEKGLFNKEDLRQESHYPVEIKLEKPRFSSLCGLHGLNTHTHFHSKGVATRFSF